MQNSFVNVAIALIFTIALFHLSANGQITLKANLQYITEKNPNEALQLVCTGFTFKPEQTKVVFWSNDEKIYDSTEVTVNGVEKINGTALSLSQNYTSVVGVNKAYCSVDEKSSNKIETIPYISKPQLTINQEKFQIGKNFTVTCYVKVFPISTEYSVTFNKEGKAFSDWSRPQGKWEWKNESAIAGGLAFAGHQPLPFSTIVTPKGREAAGKWTCSVTLPKKGDREAHTISSEEFQNSRAFGNGVSIVAVALVAFLRAHLR